mgnify:CR=1 FL=1
MRSVELKIAIPSADLRHLAKLEFVAKLTQLHLILAPESPILEKSDFTVGPIEFRPFKMAQTLICKGFQF